MAKIAGLVKKAQESGISYGTLKKVYDRGMAAWKTGHRPGTTPQQWAFARVNSYITKGKTYNTADKDLRDHVEPKKTFSQFNEDCWNGYKKEGMIEGRYTKYSDLLMQRARIIGDKGKVAMTGNNQEIKKIDRLIAKELKKLGFEEDPKEEVTEKRLADILRDKTKSQQKAHQKAMMKSARDSIKKYQKGKKEETEEKNCGCGKTPCETYGIVDDNLPEQKKVDIKKMFARVKGLSKKQLEVLASIPTPQLNVIVQQLSGLTMGEDFEPFNTIDEALSIQQRIKRGMIARRTAKKRSRIRKLKARRMKNAGELQQKAMRAARTRLAKRMLGSLNMADLSLSQKVNLAKKLEKKKDVIKKVAKRLLPAVRKQEMQRLKKFRQAQQAKKSIWVKSDSMKDKAVESISLFKDWWSEAANAAQQAAIAIAKKKKQKNEEPKYNLGDGNCNDSYLELGTDKIRKVYSKDTPGQANESMDPKQFAKNNFVVSYQNNKRKEKEKLVFGANMQKDAINYANKANKVDKDGGKYTVYKNNRGMLKSI
jgi:hypothetical protein